MTKNRFSLLLIAIALSLASTSCIYRVPDDDEVSLIPNTNNPQVIGDKAQGMVPGGAF